ncbi:MAG: META domain-containing protein [Acidimicrobiia bacterium]|nr:META domain-containing protein [Acidimicrobiia bacterium]
MTRRLAALLAVTALAIAACGDSGDSATTAPGGTVPPTTQAPDPAPFAATNWVVVSFGLDGADDPVLPNAVPTLRVGEDGLSVGGTTGCNSYFGTATLAGTAGISFGGLGWTEMACLDEGVMDQEHRFTQALGSVDGFALSDNSLVLRSSDESAVIRLVPETPAAVLPLGGDWRLTTFIDGETASSVLAGTEVTFNLDTDDGTFSGNAGCNGYSGSMALDVVTETGAGASITMGPTVSTLMACEPDVMDQETAFHMILSDATTMVVDGGFLTIATDDGRALVFEPAAG